MTAARVPFEVTAILPTLEVPETFVIVSGRGLVPVTMNREVSTVSTFPCEAR